MFHRQQDITLYIHSIHSVDRYSALHDPVNDTRILKCHFGRINATFLLLGYFTHVTTLAEVKEQVLKYVPVMARPMVMYRDKHPIQWTGVYADIEVSSSSI